MALAAARRDEELKKILRIQNPERIRAMLDTSRARAQDTLEKAMAANNAPRMVSLLFTRTQFEAYEKALGKARGRLAQAQATIDMVEELSSAQVVAVAAALKEVLGDGR